MSLSLIIGPMWSGKTTELLRLYDRKQHVGIKCLLINHCIDQRYQDKTQTPAVVTHVNSYGMSERAPAMMFSSIGNIINYLGSKPMPEPLSLFIDEIQFFPEKERIIELMDSGIDIVAAGLNGDYNRKLFEGMGALLSASTEIKMLTAVCGKCKVEGACYTKRIAVDQQEHQIDVGGSDKYMAVCHRCYIGTVPGEINLIKKI